MLLGTLAGTRTASTQQTAHRLSTTISIDVEGDYLLYLPSGYEGGQDDWPLLLFLHGAGERGSDLDLVKKLGPPKLIEEGREFPFIVASPQVPEGRRWEVEYLTALLDELTEKYRVDESRIYVTGLSMGGFGTWSLATDAPHRFAAIAPICGGGDPLVACRLKNTPTWVFHGALDPVVPVDRSIQMVRALTACDGNVRFTVYPMAGHDSWTETYANPEFYEWLLKHQLKK
jgi:predicted peptidase